MVVISSLRKVLVKGGHPSQTSQPQTSLSVENKALDLIRGEEKFSANSYSDYKQNSSGYGTKAVPGEGPITREVAEKRMREHAAGDRKAVRKIDRKYGYDFTDNQIAALTSFSYNLGPGALDTLTQNGRRSKEEIANALLKYNKADGKTLKGLVDRRRKERELYLS